MIRPSRASWDRGSSPGLNSLLSRHLPESRLAAACVAAWKESRLSFGRVNRLPDPETMDRIQALVSDPALKNNPVKAYNQIDEQVSKQ